MKDYEGTVVYQSADVHLRRCISTPTGLCWPDLGVMSGGSRTFFGPGWFWTLEFGNATMGGPTPGYSDMVRTHHAVLTNDWGRRRRVAARRSPDTIAVARTRREAARVPPLGQASGGPHDGRALRS
jgi:hypothetical protein